MHCYVKRAESEAKLPVPKSRVCNVAGTVLRNPCQKARMVVAFMASS